MSQSFELNAEVRTDLGKGASRRLRHSDTIPAILYGLGREPVALTLVHNDVLKALSNEAFFSHVLTLNVGGKKESALLKAVQRHPYKPKIVHLDFLAVDATHVVHTNVPLHFLNEDKAPGLKKGGRIQHAVTNVEVTCLPSQLPEFLEVNVGNLDLGQSVHLSQIALPAGVTLVELSKGEGHDQAVVSLIGGKATGDEEAV